METDVIFQPYEMIAVQADSPKASAAILNTEFEGDHLRVELKDGRILFLPLSWLPIHEDVLSSLPQPMKISPDGSTLVWPEVPAYLHLKDVLSGGEACDRCWYRVSYFK